ncbi:hypothetical protein AMJ44_09905 [candidate division WOR-1 bacterium DG_54_3]|uniref:Uncharacterized protein n=1 Tax=candidate division WOR-1 bacterium DG_54_3 TaxID=1703775 RepID=A0A0S7XSZ9_UNCSA|nr:MAG: hypothetical protein AMJ44_09905 [candidate division WOR-1 bacterium DG_54_3]
MIFVNLYRMVRGRHVWEHEFRKGLEDSEVESREPLFLTLNSPLSTSLTSLLHPPPAGSQE